MSLDTTIGSGSLDSGRADHVGLKEAFSSDVRHLTRHISASLRRGTRLSIALARFGHHWMSSECGDYELSEEVGWYHAFISHDWQTPYWLKIWSLILVFNCRAAAFVGIGVSIVSSAIENWIREEHCSKMVYVGGKRVCSSPCVWSYLVSVAAMLAALCFWQRFRSAILRSPTMIFFDKLCIAQADEVKKQQGILHLAGFLRHSQKLVVLWTPRYFSRLWCAFELAAWTCLQNVGLEVMPVNLALLVGLHMALWSLSVVPVLLMPETIWNRILQASLLGPFILPMIYLAGHLDRDLRDLRAQLEGFRIRKSKCFCCTNDHRCPRTGKRLPCDRKLVYSTLQVWLQDTGAADETSLGDAELGINSAPEVAETDSSRYLDLFDKYVQEDLAPRFTEAVRGSAALYLLCVRSIGMVYWCFACSASLGSLLKLDVLSCLRLVLGHLEMMFLVLPTGFVFGLRIADIGENCSSIPPSLKVPLRAIAHYSFYALMWTAVWWTRQFESWMPQVILTLCVVLMTALAFASCKASG